MANSPYHCRSPYGHSWSRLHIPSSKADVGSEWNAKRNGETRLVKSACAYIEALVGICRPNTTGVVQPWPALRVLISLPFEAVSTSNPLGPSQRVGMPQVSHHPLVWRPTSGVVLAVCGLGALALTSQPVVVWTKPEPVRPLTALKRLLSHRRSLAYSVSCEGC